MGAGGRELPAVGTRSPVQDWRSFASYMAWMARRVSACSRRGSLSRTFRVRWFRQRWWRVSGKTSSKAAHSPRPPSPRACQILCVRRDSWAFVAVHVS